MKLKLDLHDIYNSGAEIEKALKQVFDEAVAKKAPVIEIIPGKGSGQLKKHVLRFLERKDIKPLLPPGGEGLEELRAALRPLSLVNQTEPVSTITATLIIHLVQTGTNSNKPRQPGNRAIAGQTRSAR